VKWSDISAVKAVVETATEALRADPSQGSHFFHNITSLDISYLSATVNGRDFVDWNWLKRQPPENATAYLRHVKLSHPLTVKIDGKKSEAVIFPKK
jgi:hypothetical protein